MGPGTDGNARLWYGRPVIDLESYVQLVLAVQRVESQVSFLNDETARLRHRLREIDRILVQGTVSRETEEEERSDDPTLF